MTTPFALILNQGRVADRTDGALVGARRVADALSALLQREPVVVGTPGAGPDGRLVGRAARSCGDAHGPA
ncbi:hypothetical protein AB1285_18360 [Microbacterium sp. NRRL B-14842]|uniref:hypothetical protein n=1 Tax=Microbacterium sp. NRRL B-14842 TaxID=3162881 RepID=UPI003D27C6D1